MKILQLITTIMLLCIFFDASGQKNMSKPPWVIGEIPTSSNETYSFKYFIGESNSLNDAKEKAYNALIIDLASSQGVSISSNAAIELKRNMTEKSYSESESLKSSYTIDKDNFKASFTKADEYWEYNNNKNIYTYYILFAIANNGNEFNYSGLKISTNYGFSAVWRSTLIPGWGQFYKKQNKKAICFLGGSTLLLVGTLLSHNLSQSYYTQAYSTTNKYTRQEYLDKSNTMEISRNVLAVSTVIVYLYNIIDAATSRGEKHYITLSPSIQESQVQKEYALGISLQIRIQ